MTTDRGLLEVRVLRALCTSARAAQASEFVNRLAGYEWTEADHAVVFGAIRGAVDRRAELTRETLAALATRAGFPDLQWDVYFDADAQPSVDEAVSDLLRSSR